MSEELFLTEAETAILSILLKNPIMLDQLQNLKDFMFSSGPNQVLFATIKELEEQKLVPEVNLIDSFLKSQNRDLEAGGRDYLNHLFKLNYNQDNTKEFERIVVDSYIARNLISMSKAIPNKVKETADVREVVETIRKNLDNLTATNGGELTSTFAETLKLSWEDLKYKSENPGVSGLTTGLRTLDSALNGLSKGDLIVVAGRPSQGKSAMFCNWMLKQGEAGKASLIFSLEMGKVALTERMIAIHSGITSSDLRFGLLNGEKLERISANIRTMKEYPIFIDANYFSDISYLTATARRYKKTHDIQCIYLDYLQLLAERTADATNEIGRITRALKLLANDLEIPVVLGSQLNRGVEAREDRRPQLQDLRQSGSIEEDADIVLGLYRDVIYNKKTADKTLMELIILKHRNGPTGMLPVTFEPEITKVSDRL